MRTTLAVAPGVELVSELSRIEDALRALAAGRMCIVVDDANRENEGDLVMAAEHATPEAINFMATHARGLICVPMTRERLAKLEIPPMVASNRDRHGTAFHVGVDDRRSASTGISAGDRAAVIRSLADPASTAADFTRPGHVFPLAYRPGGVLERRGHTEASVDLAIEAGLGPAAVICEIADEDGSMARLPRLLDFAREHGMPCVSIEDLVAYRQAKVAVVERVSSARMPLAKAVFEAHGYRALDGREHLALVLGNVSDASAAAPLVRLHSECVTGDVFGSRRCDCGPQLELAVRQVVDAGRGVLIYMRGHEGRGIGLVEKLRAYALQEQGFDTVDANVALGHPPDARDYGPGAAILADLGIEAVRLLTNNPAKQESLEAHGIAVTECVPLLTTPTTANLAYLETKQTRMGHRLAVMPPSDDIPVAAAWAS